MSLPDIIGLVLAGLFFLIWGIHIWKMNRDIKNNRTISL